MEKILKHRTWYEVWKGKLPHSARLWSARYPQAQLFNKFFAPIVSLSTEQKTPKTRQTDYFSQKTEATEAEILSFGRLW